MKKNLLLFGCLFLPTILLSQIHAPEGLNMPGSWNSWTNPPSTNSVFGSEFQVTGGKVKKITTGTVRWQTTINVQSSGGNITGGSYEFVFTSGPSGSPYNNKWGNVGVTMNTLQSYTFSSGASNNTISLTNGKWYTMNWADAGYASTQVIFMETSAEPVNLVSVTNNFSTRGSGNNGTVTVTTSDALSAEEKIFVRYTTDGWSTSNFVQATGSGTTYTASIPDAVIVGYNGNDEYYILTTTVAAPTHSTADMVSIKINNNSGANYPLPVELRALSGTVINGKVRLTWSTITETNNTGFEVQSSTNGEWKSLGFIEGHGSSNISHNYSFTDHSSSIGKNLYRLKQIDHDGKTSFSNQIEVIVGLSEMDFTLSQNFPNPFNPTTNISFAVKERQFVSLKVFNLVGQEVTTLVNGIVEPNMLQTVEFNGKDLSSGIYFYSLTTNNRHEVRKLMLMK